MWCLVDSIYVKWTERWQVACRKILCLRIAEQGQSNGKYMTVCNMTVSRRRSQKSQASFSPLTWKFRTKTRNSWEFVLSSLIVMFVWGKKRSTTPHRYLRYALLQDSVQWFLSSSEIEVQQGFLMQVRPCKHFASESLSLASMERCGIHRLVWSTMNTTPKRTRPNQNAILTKFGDCSISRFESTTHRGRVWWSWLIETFLFISLVAKRLFIVGPVK